jgi:hypothetical protein
MARGGKRSGAGRKSTWQSGCQFTETKLIRVPIVIAEQILDIAHRLDAGETIDFDAQSNHPSTDLVTNSLEMIVAASAPTASVNAVKKGVQKNLNSGSGDIELSDYGWIQPPGAKSEHCFLKGKSLCGKWSYKGRSLHDRPNDYSSCRDCWVKYGKIVEKNKTLKRQA